MIALSSSKPETIISPNNRLETTALWPLTDPGVIVRAASLLRAGRVVVFPTDTLYGIGVDARNEAAVARLYQIKQRPAHKGIPILLADTTDLPRVAVNIPDAAWTYMERFWPGPLTLLLQKHPDLPPNLSPNDKIATRVIDHDASRALFRAAGGVIATSSANISGREPALEAAQALQTFDGLVAAVLDGGTAPLTQSSTIIDCTTTPPRMIRPGPISADQLAL